RSETAAITSETREARFISFKNDRKLQMMARKQQKIRYDKNYEPYYFKLKHYVFLECLMPASSFKIRMK
ncbi:MAG: hypothetical protein U0L49_02045, partial [Eubacterium sp.]|nr:hypothetical protein [Eubacterium sp.]